MNRVRIAQIGVGHDHAAQTYQSLVKNSDLFEVVGVAPENDSHADKLRMDAFANARIISLDEALCMDDLDAVAIESEELLATGLAQRFADRGIALHLDKPGAPDWDSFQHLIQTVKKKRTPFQMGYMFRYNPVIQRAVRMAKQGKLGEIFSVEGQMSVYYEHEKRQWLHQFPGGMMYFLGCHMIDLVMQIQGVPRRVIPANCQTGILCDHTEDLGVALLQYDHGVSYVKSCAAEINGAMRRQLVISGSGGTVEIRPLEIYSSEGVATPARATLLENNPQDWKDCAEAWCSYPVDRYDSMMRCFAGMVRGEYTNPYTYDYELALFRVILECCGVLS